jgi:6-phosphogluconate dehydrogenase
LKEERVKASGLYKCPTIEKSSKDVLEKMAEEALYFGFIITYAQGFHQLTEASKEYGYALNLSTIAKIWRAGCIIRAGLLKDIAVAYSNNNKLSHLLLDALFIEKVEPTVQSVRKLISLVVRNGIPSPGLSNSLTYFDALTSDKLPLNLIQAQRDYFGSHTYERIDREGIFHTQWSK